MTDQEVVQEIKSDSRLNKARQKFSLWSAICSLAVAFGTALVVYMYTPDKTPEWIVVITFVAVGIVVYTFFEQMELGIDD